MDKTFHLKQTLRTIAKNKRRANAEFQKHYTPTLLTYLYQLIRTLRPYGGSIACFWPMQDEVDCRPIMDQLHQEKYQILLPKTPPKGQALTFHLWSPNMALKNGLYGTQYPDTTSATPDVVVVPLLGFDYQGNRLGYGGGYYDRTLATLPNVHSAGVAFSYQAFDHIPSESFDYSLPVLVTEEGIFKF